MHPWSCPKSPSQGLPANRLLTRVTTEPSAWRAFCFAASRCWPGVNVAVQVRRHGDGRVPKPLLHDLEMHPLASVMLAWVRRRSCKRIRGTPARWTRVSKRRDTHSGCHAEPSGGLKTRPVWSTRDQGGLRPHPRLVRVGARWGGALEHGGRMRFDGMVSEAAGLEEAHARTSGRFARSPDLPASAGTPRPSRRAAPGAPAWRKWPELTELGFDRLPPTAAHVPAPSRPGQLLHFATLRTRPGL